MPGASSRKESGGSSGCPFLRSRSSGDGPPAAAPAEPAPSPAAPAASAGAAPSPAAPAASAGVDDDACATLRLADVECGICMRLLWEPVTTPCGHTLCRPCLLRALDHQPKCPLCRQCTLHVGGEPPVTVVLQGLLRGCFPAEYAARGAEELAAAAAVAPAGAPLPVFVMSAVLPGERMALNIFEPRYRLMVRRCMAGGRAFGMAAYDAATGGPASVATEVEILECDPQPDGRFLIEVRGRRRFRLVGPPGATDGYATAVPEYFGDAPVPEGEAAALAAAAAEVGAAADAWCGRLRAAHAVRRSAAELLWRAGPRPAAAAGPEALSWWAAALVLPLMERSPLKGELLAGDSTLGRLVALQGLLKQVSEAHVNGCSLQ